MAAAMMVFREPSAEKAPSWEPAAGMGKKEEGEQG